MSYETYIYVHMYVCLSKQKGTTPYTWRYLSHEAKERKETKLAEERE